MGDFRVRRQEKGGAPERMIAQGLELYEAIGRAIEEAATIPVPAEGTPPDQCETVWVEDSSGLRLSNKQPGTRQPE